MTTPSPPGTRPRSPFFTDDALQKNATHCTVRDRNSAVPEWAMIEFWYDFASTYSHIAAQRIDALAKAAGTTVRWRPFLLGPIFAGQGWSTSPFNLFPSKGKYMWRDMERWSAELGLKLVKPQPFPANSLMAARIALAGEEGGWIGDFSRRVFAAEFCEGANIADLEVLRAILSAMNLNPTQILDAARADAVKSRLRSQTDLATHLGLFGAPSFVVDGEIFWGNDRLEEALRWSDRPWA